ncbi:MAG: FAD-dependent oxidoreductase [Gammaproteobacteria bacterium]|nr:FAD-dependent oxidoreductase [Gammaproteobacteria bacterium]
MGPSGLREISTRCCIVGGGPAGMMLGLLLARAGIAVTLLEKHADFLRDFRGDTVHPSTLEVLRDTGLLESFLALPHREEQQLMVQFADGMLAFADFRGLRPFPFLVFVPQWDFLELLAGAARRYPHYTLLMRAEAETLIQEDGRVVGVRADTADGPLEVRADLVVGTDGRHSTLRAAAGLQPRQFGAPMDVLWFRISRRRSDPDQTFGIAGRGQMMALINRNDYWQAGFIIPKGSGDARRRRPIMDFQAEIARVAPFLSGRTGEIRSWQDVSLLSVGVDRLERWHLPGLLLIGDAAHVMSPVGGVGINLAVQDAVAAANIVGPVLCDGKIPDERLLACVQRRRMLPTRIVQGIQRLMQRNILERVLSQEGPPPPAPAAMRFLFSFRFVRRIPARVFGLGFRRERVRLPAAPVVNQSVQ